MKKIISQICGGGAKSLKYLLAGLFAFALALAETAQAADRNWTGGQTGVANTEASPYNITNTSNWSGSGNLGSGQHLYFSVSEKTFINSESNAQVGGDFNVNSGDFVFSGPLYFLKFANKTAGASASIVKKGDWSIGNSSTAGYGFWLANAANVSVAFTNATGNVTLTGTRSNNSSSLYVANGENSVAEIVSEVGDWTVSQCLFLAKGANSTGRFILKGGVMTVKNYLVVGQGSGATGSLIVEGGEVKQTGNDIPIGDGASSTGIVTVKTGGKITSSSAYNGYGIRVGGNGTGTLNVQGGEVYLGSGSGALGMCTSSGYSPAGTVNVTDGGLVTASQIKHGNGSGTGTLTINGGTLKALGDNASFIPADDNLTVYVGDDGATFNTDNHAITVAEPLVALSGEAGSLTVTGGGTLTASGDLTGAFTVGENTALHYFDQDGAVANYAISTINIAPGATLYLDADATGCDTFGAATTNITATSANPATITLVFSSAAPAGTAYTLFDTVDGSEFVVVPMLGALELPHEVSVVNGKLTLTITAEDYTWNGSQTYWGNADAWTKGGASASWSDGNNAIFDTAGREAVLSAAASASEVRFTANAAISGTAALSASKIDVSSGATATISAPFGSAVQKTGAGTLTLAGSAANAYDLTLAEGTLALGGTSSLDWTKFVFGADPLKPVTLRVGADAALANNSAMTFGNIAGVTSTLVKEGGDWTVSGMFLMCRDVADATANFIHNGGTLTVGNYFSVGDCADATFSSLEINGGTVNSTHSGSYATIGATCDATGIVRNGGVFNVSGNLLVGNHASGTLTIDDGGTVNTSDIIFHYSDNGGASLVNLKAGGVLSPYRIYYRTNGNNEDCTFKFDGGTVKCNYATLVSAHDRLFVKVASNGGIIDLQGKTVAIEEPLLEDAESTGGGMTFKGGGVVTLASGNTYTGTTTVEVGTTVHVAAPAEIGGGIAVTVPETAPADGVYKLVVVDGAGTFSDAVLTGVVAPANATLRLSGDNKSILCIYGNPPNTWVGGASGSLNDNANWSLGTVPAAGESCVIGNPAAASLTNPSGSAFAPSVITFSADTALVTISGEGVISGITAITNNASLHHVFNCPVVCADNITPDITRGSGNYMTFAGGITMYNAPKTGGTTDYWSGNVAVTTEVEQVFKSSGSKNYAQLVSGTTFSFDNGNIDHMHIAPGATAVVNTLVYNGCARSSKTNNKTAWFNFVFDNGNGVLRAKEIKATGDAVLFHSYADSDQQGGTIIAEKLTSATTAMTGGGGWDWPLFFLNCSHTTGSGFIGNAANGEGVWVIGRGGLSFGSDAIAQSFYGVHLGKTLDNGRPAATLHSYEDWALDVHPLGTSQTALEISSGNGELLVIDTSHYAVGDPVLDAATSHTVTLNGKVQGGGAMRVEGNGKVVFANANNAFSGGLTVTNTATVSVKAGCKPGAGAVTMATGTTLEVAESGTATVGGNLTLDDGATLAFNFTERGKAPTLAMASGKTVTAAGSIKVAVSGVWPKGESNGEVALTSGGAFTGVSNDNVSLADGCPSWAKSVKVEGGNLVLEVKTLATMILVR